VCERELESEKTSEPVRERESGRASERRKERQRQKVRERARVREIERERDCDLTDIHRQTQTDTEQLWPLSAVPRVTLRPLPAGSCALVV